VRTRRLEGTLLPGFGELAIGKVDGAAAAQVDLELSERGLARATRNNVQVVIRSVLRLALLIIVTRNKRKRARRRWPARSARED